MKRNACPKTPTTLLSLAILGALMFAPACDADGLCAPEPCGGDEACPSGTSCVHGACATTCDPAIGTGCPPAAKCVIDGVAFCADADGLPIVACPVTPPGARAAATPGRAAPPE